MNYFSDPSPFRARAGLGLAALASAVLIAGCGSSGSSGSSSIAINNQNKADEALTKSSTPSSSTGSASTTATTPTSGPLSKEPTVIPPKGPPPSTLVIKNLVPGTGAEAKTASTITVNDVGVVYSTGKQFENTFKRNEPSTFPLSQVIPGWQKGIPGMKVGGRRELIIPPSLAYGAAGRPPSIPPNSTLVFVIDLLGA